MSGRRPWRCRESFLRKTRKPCANVIFHFSIDDIEERLEYIRYPSDWNQIESQIHKLDNYPYKNLTLTTAWTAIALNIYYLPEFLKWKLKSKFKLLNRWPHGGGLFSCHLAYWPPQLNVKVLPQWFKNEVVQKFDEELYPWLKENWKMCTGVEDVSYNTWSESEYSLKRIKGLTNFMIAEDWSVRLSETNEWCYKVADQRKINFNKTFPDYDWLQWYNVHNK